MITSIMTVMAVDFSLWDFLINFSMLIIALISAYQFTKSNLEKRFDGKTDQSETKEIKENIKEMNRIIDSKADGEYVRELNRAVHHRIDGVIQNTNDQLAELKNGQTEMRQDIKEILKRLPRSNE